MSGANNVQMVSVIYNAIPHEIFRSSQLAGGVGFTA
jgi:hypothetical protein